MKTKLGKILEKNTINNVEMIYRHIKWEDVDKLLDFVNKISREDTYVMLSGEEVTRKQEIDYISNSISQIEKGDKVHLVITTRGKIVGNAEVRPDERRRKHIGTVTIAIDSEYRGKGLGTKLMSHIIQEAKNIGLRLLLISVFDINIAGNKVYQKIGFKRYGKVPGALYYKGKYVSETYYYLSLVD